MNELTLPEDKPVREKPKKKKCPISYKAYRPDKNSFAETRVELEPGTNESLTEVIQDLTNAQGEEFANHLLTLTGEAMGTGNQQDNFNIAVQALHDLKPADAIETMLCSQMVALHTLAMQEVRRADHVEIQPYRQYNLSRAFKCMRLHHETIETLERYRRKGEQRIVIQNVTVADGGKAVVNGDVTF
jgi:hypothetical protein